MFVPKVQFKQAADLIKNLMEGWEFVRSTDIVVGITEESNGTRKDGESNAEILYKNETGEPSKNIPPRPVLKPATAQPKVKKQVGEMIRNGAVAAFKGDVKTAEQYYEKAGMLGRDACRDYILEGSNLAPNSPVTIARKGSSLPLVDTGQMLGAISYAVRKKEK